MPQLGLTIGLLFILTSSSSLAQDVDPPLLINRTLMNGGDCHSKCDTIDIYDTVGVDGSIAQYSLDSIDNIGLFINQDIHMLCVSDTMRDGSVIFQVTDNAGNKSSIKRTFCTTPDTFPPYADPFQSWATSWEFRIRDDIRWSRFLSHVELFDTMNVAVEYLSVLPGDEQSLVLINAINMQPGSQHLWRMRVYDLAGNVSDTIEGYYAVASVESIAASAISISPNPAHSIVTVRGLPATMLRATIVDALGREVWSGDLMGPETSLPINDLAPGHHLLRIHDGAASDRHSFVVVR